MFFLQWAPDLRFGDAMQGKPNWEGTVTFIDIIARDLLPPEKGTCDPQAKILLNSKKKHKTEIITKNTNPRWMNINFSLCCTSEDVIEIELHHKKSEEGKISFKVSEPLKLASTESPFLTKTWKLKPIKKVTNIRGTLTLTMTFSPTIMGAKKKINILEFL